MTDPVRVQIYGSRGSFPTSGSEHARYGGATPCVVIEVGARRVVLDAGTGLVRFGREQVAAHFARGEPLDTSIFLSHLHFDHVLGLPFFAPMYLPSATVRVFGPRMGAYASCFAALETIIHPPFFPVPLHEMSARKHFADMSEAVSVYYLRGQASPVLASPAHPDDEVPDPDEVELQVDCMRGYNHPKSGVLLYRVRGAGRSIVYATDTEGYVHGDQRLIKFAHNADLLIHDAMYTSDRYISMPAPTQGYGHSTVEIAAGVAKRAGAKRLALFHHDPAATDEELDKVMALGDSLFSGTVAAHDGVTFDL